LRLWKRVHRHSLQVQHSGRGGGEVRPWRGHRDGAASTGRACKVVDGKTSRNGKKKKKQTGMQHNQWQVIIFVKTLKPHEAG